MYQYPDQQKLREEYEREKTKRFKDINILELKIRDQITIQNVNDLNKFGRTILNKAVTLGTIKCVERLLELGANPLIQNNFGQCALYGAAQNGNLEIIQLLVNNMKKSLIEIDLNKILTKRRLTLIHSACHGIREGYDGCWEIIEYLIVEHSMDPWARDEDGRTPKDYLDEYEHGYIDLLKKCYHEKYSKKYIEYEKDHKINEHEFMKKMRTIDSDNVNMMLNGETILHQAIDHGSILVIRSLLELKADPLMEDPDPRSKDSFSNISLFRAIMRGKVDAISLLIQHMENCKNVKLDLNTILRSNKDTLIHGAIHGINQGNNECWLIIERLIAENKMNPFIENDLHLAPRDILNDMYVDQYDDLLEKLGCYLELENVEKIQQD